jgi:hypothetical protein
MLPYHIQEKQQTIDVCVSLFAFGNTRQTVRTIVASHKALKDLSAFACVRGPSQVKSNGSFKVLALALTVIASQLTQMNDDARGVAGSPPFPVADHPKDTPRRWLVKSNHILFLGEALKGLHDGQGNSHGWVDVDSLRLEGQLMK